MELTYELFRPHRACVERTFWNHGVYTVFYGSLEVGNASSVYDVRFGLVQEGRPLDTVAVNNGFAEFSCQTWMLNTGVGFE